MSTYPLVTELLPHAAPMLAIDELLHWEPGFSRTRLVIREGDLFVVDGEVDALCALEYMAQGVAACLGQESWVEGNSIRVGMVIACREMSLQRTHFRVGEEFLLEARCVRGSDYVSHYDTEMCTADGTPVAKATLTLVHGDRPPETA